VYLKQYQTFQEAQENIVQFLEDVYHTSYFIRVWDMSHRWSLNPLTIKRNDVDLCFGLVLRVHSILSPLTLAYGELPG